MKRLITTKADFYRRWLRGEFPVNSSRIWSSPEAIAADGYKGPIAIRTKRLRGRCDYGVPPEQVASRVHSFVADGYRLDELILQEGMDDTKVVIQGEVMCTTFGLVTFTSQEKMHMRGALHASGVQHQGLAAEMLLRKYISPGELETIRWLIDEYDAVVEFTTLSHNFGCIPGCRTAIWEVRSRY